jgi:acid phosphatase family membrane protein YuiD
MTNVPGARAQPVSVSTNKARGGVTGHHVRYVLAGGLAGIIVAFIVIALSFGWF